MAAKAEKPRTLADLSTEDLMCRWPERHGWRLTETEVTSAGLSLTLVCRNECGTSKVLRTTRGGVPLGPARYHHDPEFLLKGIGKRPSSQEVREEVVGRLLSTAVRRIGKKVA